jgi:hypothetical protein
MFVRFILSNFSSYGRVGKLGILQLPRGNVLVILATSAGGGGGRY